MGWGPVDWVGRVLPEPKFENKCTSFFEFFWIRATVAEIWGVRIFGHGRGEERTRTEWRILGSGCPGEKIL